MVRPVVILCKYLSYEATGGAPVVFSAEERSLRDSALFVKTPRAMLPDALFVNPTRDLKIWVSVCHWVKRQFSLSCMKNASMKWHHLGDIFWQKKLLEQLIC